MQFSVWIERNELQKINKNDRTALLNFARDLPAARKMLEQTNRYSLDMIWRERPQKATSERSELAATSNSHFHGMVMAMFLPRRTMWIRQKSTSPSSFVAAAIPSAMSPMETFRQIFSSMTASRLKFSASLKRKRRVRQLSQRRPSRYGATSRNSRSNWDRPRMARVGTCTTVFAAL